MLANSYTNPRSAMIAPFLKTTKKACIVEDSFYIKSVFMCENKAEGWNVGGMWVVCFLQITDLQPSRYQYVNSLGGMGGIANAPKIL